MSTREEEFLRRLKATFQLEAEEHLQTMSAALLEVEKVPAAEHAPHVEIIFREAHSLKGASRAIDMGDIESVCQAVESVLSVWKKQQLTPSDKLFDVLHSSLALLEDLLNKPESEQIALAAKIPPLLEQLEQLELGGGTSGQELSTEAAEPSAGQDHSRNGLPVGEINVSEKPAEAEPSPSSTVDIIPAPKSPPVSTAPKPHEPEPKSASPRPLKTANQSETIRIATAKLDSLLRQVEELLAIKMTVTERSVQLKEVKLFVDDYTRKIAKAQTELRGNRSFGQQQAASGEFAQFGDFMEITRSMTRTLESKIGSLTRAAEQDRRLVASMIDNLLADIKRVLMVPVGSSLEMLPKLVRDLARTQQKEVALEIEGGEIEVDRRILEEMKDPLIHLLRNSVDHGLEAPDERELHGKPRQSKISIQVSARDGGNVEIIITDDGRGINITRVKEAARRLGHLTDERAAELHDKDAVMLIFQSELSTSSIITDLSGRGLGMAIVREKIEKMGGRISVETEQGKGTSFRILLPLTLATFRGVLVEAGARPFVIPTSRVERVMRLETSQMQTARGRRTMVYEGRTISLVRLDDILGLPRAATAGPKTRKETVIVIGSSHEFIGFIVDRIVDEQEVLVKNMGKQLARVKNIAAATVLGSGKVVPILSVQDLLKSTALAAGGGAARGDRPEGENSSGTSEAKSILIAEDSITSRMLLKNILESAGYHVTATIDGAEAFSTLKSGRFDLVISDVEMPRMTGFELTAKIRGDTELANTPVVLVTSLGSREHQEKGVEVGANGYIIKSNFDQSNLLEVVRRLI